MGFLLGLEKIKVEYPSKIVFEDLSLGINSGDRIGVVGQNGDGKSTLLSLLANEAEYQEGRVICTHGVKVGYLKQSDEFDAADTVGQLIVGDMPEYEWASNSRIRGVLKGLIEDIPWDSAVGELSGGQRRRVDIARVLVGDFDVILLDEPTNHLDLESIYWLAQHLKQRWNSKSGAYAVVTHDRWFLDEVCLTMWEVHNKRIVPFEGGFSAYIMQRVERDRVERVTEERRQNKLRRELAWLSRGARARSTKPKFHVREAQKLIEDVPPLRDELELKRMAVTRLGKQVVEIKHVSVGYGKTPVLVDIDWIVGPGDRIGIIGKNGAGKTTLINMIQGKMEAQKGFIKIGKTVKFATLTQDLDNLRKVSHERVREVISQYGYLEMIDGKKQTPKQLLERLGFKRPDFNEPIESLSGGQKRRLALMLILLEEPNFLILDEPGNDLDVDMLAAVEDLLDGWPGTLILISHDRYLLERTTDNQYALINGGLRHLPGGIDEYIEIMEEVKEAAESEGKKTSSESLPNQGELKQNKDTRKLSNQELRALKKSLASTERKMSTLRSKIDKEKEAMLEVDPSDYEQLGSFQEKINQLQDDLNVLEETWIEISEKLE